MKIRKLSSLKMNNGISPRELRSLMMNNGNSPRIGDNYQANIPPMIKKSDYLKLDLPASYSLGSRSKDQKPISENKFENESLSVHLPGCPSKKWMGIERESFVLGLYLFNKNLVLVERLVGSKKMGEVLCFYYGKFFNSISCIGWKYCLETDSKYRVYGEMVVSGWRQEMLLKRLCCLVSEDFHGILMKSSVDFMNKTISFEDYVFAVKDIVGINVLVKAVGLGRGKSRDLTMTPREYRKSIPISKAYSSLTDSEIIEILTGNHKLTKPQSTDLFWRAVWPRLLAEGWRSERVKDHRSLGLERPLVFLVKQAKEFSRELVKGTEYFNSVSEVHDFILGSEPGILGQRKKQAPKAKPPNRGVTNTVIDSNQDGKAEPLKETKVGNLPAKTPSADTSPLLSSDVTNGSEEPNTAVQVKVSVAEAAGEHRSPSVGPADGNSAKEDSPREDKEVISDLALTPLRTALLFDLNVPYVPSDSKEDYISTELKIVIDLNIPYVGSDSETDNIGGNGDSVMEEPSQNPEESKIVDAGEEHQPMKKRAAVEAIEHESLASKKRKN